MEGDIVQMGAYIGAGLACTGMGGAAVGVGHVVGNYISGALRNPSAAAGQTATMFIGIAFAEALGIFGFLIALPFKLLTGDRIVYDVHDLWPEMFEAKFGHGIGNVFRLVHIQRLGHSGAHIAEGAGSCAGIPHDHHGGMFF